MVATISYIVIGLCAGLLSGMLGIGGGIIIVPALIYVCGFKQLDAQGTSLLVMSIPIGLLAFSEYYRNGNTNIKAGLLIAVFLVIGSLIAAKLVPYIPVTILKTGFGVLMVLVGLKMIFTK